MSLLCVPDQSLNVNIGTLYNLHGPVFVLCALQLLETVVLMLPACPWDLLNESCHYPPLPPDDPPKPTHYPCSPGSSGIPNTLHTQSLAPGHKEIEPGSCSEIG